MTAVSPPAARPVDAELGARAAGTALLIAQRLADPATVAAVAGAPDNRDPITGGAVWEPLALSHGLPGVALFYAELLHHDPRWAPIAHRYVTAAAAAMPDSPANGLYLGPASLTAAVQTAAAGTDRYARLRHNLTSWLVRDQLDRIAAAGRRERGVAWEDYDVINGLTGTARLLLDAGPDAAEAFDATLRHLVALCRPRQVDGHEVPGWWVPPELEPVEQDRHEYPHGDFNLGMAHGISGPVMLLALALQRGHEVPGQREALERSAGWLRSWTLADDTGPYHPCRISWRDETAADRPGALFTRTAWCYGAPGVGVALYRAGVALGRPEWCADVVAELHAALRRDENRWHLDGPTVCHGYAGLMQILLRIGTESRDDALIAGAERLGRKVLAHTDEDVPFVFRHLVPDSAAGWRTATGYKALNVAGILEGSAGIGCALLSLSGATSALPWDRVLMCA